MNFRKLSVAGIVLGAGAWIGLMASPASAGTVTTNLFALTGSGDEVGVKVTVDDSVLGGVQVTAEVLATPDLLLDANGDILALWFDFGPGADYSVLNSQSSIKPPFDPANLGTKITGYQASENGVATDVFSNSMKNIPSPFGGPYDAAISFGSGGASPGDYFPKISFRWEGLTAAQFEFQRILGRVTSVGLGDDMEDSGKYGGMGSSLVVVPTPSAALAGLMLMGGTLLRRRA